MFRILIADDHDIVREGLKDLLLEEFPLAFIGEANDTVSLIDLAISHSWDIVVSDIKMPGGGAFVALEKIKPQKPSLPIILISSNPAEQYADRAVKAGAEQFISKDSLSTELLKALQDILEQKTRKM